jgi:hypothetical protein
VSTSRRLQAAGVALASVLLLGGCAAGTHPGAAAVVGKTEISVGDVDKTSNAATAALGESLGTSRVLSLLVNNALVEQIAEQRAVTVTDAEVTPAMKTVAGSQAAYDKFAQDPVADKFLRGVATAALSTIKLGGGTGLDDPNGQTAQQDGLKIIKDASKNISVDIAPRFGKWKDGAIDGTVSGSLSTLSDQSAAAKKATETPTQPAQQPQG